MVQAQALLGLVLIPLLAWAISENRAHLGLRRALIVVAGTLAVQFALALVLLKLPLARQGFEALGAGVLAIQKATETGARFVFGYLAGGPAPFDRSAPQNDFIIAFRVLPVILVLSALVRLLYYWGVLQRVVRGFAYVLRRATGIGGPLATVSASSLFLGLVEAPLLIRPYLDSLGRGALFAMMAVVMATVAGTVMALYATVLEPLLPGAAGHLLAASLMNIPGALMLARLAVPDGFMGGPETADIVIEDPPRSAVDAVAKGTSDGVGLVVAVVAMLIVFVALVTLANALLGVAAAPFGLELTLQRLLGWVMAPAAWIIGIPWSEAGAAGALLGERVVLNELIAYFDLAGAGGAELSERSRLIMTYALCGFANFGSLGIMLGGLVAMLPERRQEILDLAPRSVLVGFLATLLSAALVGLATAG
ncbi:MAG: nucleoside:proton symporter [Hyphomicrobiaceae bacterium]|nr:nucleoside:proton symporter [Hyphomicrobiaceae bacterium]MCC0006740.1 nucleoside:proton symporter [Hyphomicrobiaceae bacterium]